jgi:hypothetical protein
MILEKNPRCVHLFSATLADDAMICASCLKLWNAWHQAVRLHNLEMRKGVEPCPTTCSP